jgi:hypothetical protein
MSKLWTGEMMIQSFLSSKLLEFWDRQGTEKILGMFLRVLIFFTFAMSVFLALKKNPDWESVIVFLISASFFCLFDIRVMKHIKFLRGEYLKLLLKGQQVGSRKLHWLDFFIVLLCGQLTLVLFGNWAATPLSNGMQILRLAYPAACVVIVVFGFYVIWVRKFSQLKNEKKS